MTTNDGTPEGTGPGTARNLLTGWGRDLALAIAFLTRIPVPSRGGVHDGDLGRASRAFPLVGLAVGGVAGGGMWLAAQTDIHPLACALIGMAFAALLTGALHEDGLADVADGFGGGRDREAKLRIMRDSRIGAYGVLALVFVVGIKASVLSGLPGPGLAAGALVAAAVISRGLVSAAMYVMPLARSDGLGAGAGHPGGLHALTALFLAVVTAFLVLDPGSAAAALVAAVLGAGLVALVAKLQIGGATGDVYGAVQQISETAALVAMGATAL